MDLWNCQPWNSRYDLALSYQQSTHPLIPPIHPLIPFPPPTPLILLPPLLLSHVIAPPPPPSIPSHIQASCMNLSGIKFDNHLGQSILRIKRPNDFKPELVPPTMQPLSYFNYGVLDIVGTPATSGGGGGDGSMGAASADRIFCGGLPYHLTDDQVKELLGAFGAIRTFNLVRDPGSATSKVLFLSFFLLFSLIFRPL